MPLVPVTKMHGTRNDFVLVDERTERISDFSQFARAVCDRRTGIGADGVLVILPSASGDVRMRIFNADGSEAEMCGNGVRCVAAYLHEEGGPAELRVQTLAGIIQTTVTSQTPEYRVRVNMGRPAFTTHDGALADTAFVSLGNPHVVLFAGRLDDVDLDTVGPQYDGRIPGGANVHVASKAGPSRLLVRHFERGVGKTMACGTGAVACAAAAILRGDVTSPVEVNVPGGHLVVEWDGSGEAFLTGPAVRVFSTMVDA